MSKKAKRIIVLAVVILVIVACVRIGPRNAGEGPEQLIRTKEELNQSGRKVGVSTGSASAQIAERGFPNAEIIYLDDSTTGYEAVAQGKIDAFVYDRRQMLLAVDSGRSGVRLLNENMDEGVRVAAGISPVSGIPNLKSRLNEFIAEIKADGTLDDMFHRWVELRDETMPEITPAKKPKYHLKIGTTGIAPPYSYYVGTGLNGYDIELAYRFAAWLGADIEFRVYDYGAIIAAAAAGDVDCIMANLNITPERAEAIPFSDELYTEQVGILVRGEADVTSLRQLASASIGVMTGTTTGPDVAARLPDAQPEYYDTLTDMLTALKTGKVDAICVDVGMIRYMMIENDDLVMLDEKLSDVSMAPAFAKDGKGPELCEQYNRFIREIRSNGTLDRISEIWFGKDEAARTVLDYENLTGENGTVTMAVDASLVPFAYIKDRKIVGYDVDVMARFCEANGYRMEVVNMSFGGILAAIQSGKVDFSACNITVTEERAEQVLFGEPDFQGGNVITVLKKSGGSSEKQESAWTNVKTSFDKTFVREDRWRLFTQGVLNTLVITLLSVLCGTVLGFLVFMLCRNGNKAANGIMRFATWLVQGMPVVVLLMVLYYIVFAVDAEIYVTLFGRKILSLVFREVEAQTVAIIGFSMIFGAAVFSLLKLGVGTVDKGQYEAAYALGYSGRRTFFRIILPQALPHVMPAYRGEIVSLIKATAVVGYIAVQDLTKMGDIVRSRTYDAFFPLIAITVIYFALEGLIGFAVSRIGANLNPKRRKPEKILKGVKTGD